MTITNEQVALYMQKLVEGQTNTSIKLSSGRWYDFTQPTPMSIHEVAPALAKLCRFTGQCEIFYSVAQHSVLVSYLIEPKYAFWGLMHDAPESVIADINSPLKRMLGDYKTIESRVGSVIMNGFGLNGPEPQAVKDADMMAFVYEQYSYMNQDAEMVKWVKKHIPQLHQGIGILAPKTVEESYSMFMKRYKELGGVL